MYKLIVDNCEFSEVTLPPENLLSQIMYTDLRLHSRPVIDSIFGESMRRVRVLVSIRTDLTNEIIMSDNFYIECTESYPNEHPLDDTVMLAAKSVLEKMFSKDCSIPDVIIRTTPYPVGACISNDQIYVYMNVIIDHTLKSEKFFKLKDGWEFKKIKDLTPKTPLEKALVDSLIIVKGDNEDA